MLLYIFFPLLVLCGSAALAAEALPVISPPAGFEEGTQTSLSGAQISELLPWAQNSESALRDLKETVLPLSPEAAKAAYLKGLQDVVLASAPKQTELLMRYVLYRALKIQKEIDTSAHDLTQELRVLSLSVDLAVRYYQSDIAFLNGRVEKREAMVNPDYAEFGLRYAAFLMAVDDSLLNASAQYNVAVMAMGLLQWDLYRDVNKMAYAPAIIKIQNMLKTLPENIPTASGRDVEAVRALRAVKMIYRSVLAQLNAQRKQLEPETVLTKEGEVVVPTRPTPPAKPSVGRKPGPHGPAGRSATTGRAELLYGDSGIMKKCLPFYNATYTTEDAANRCIEVIQSGFDSFDDPVFKECHLKMNNTYTSAKAADSCVVYSQQGKLAYFKQDYFCACYKYLNNSLTAADAIIKCVDYADQKFDFFEDTSFKKCVELENRTLTSYDSVKQCIHYQRRQYSFENKLFLSCFELRNAGMKSHDAVTACLKEIYD